MSEALGEVRREGWLLPIEDSDSEGGLTPPQSPKHRALEPPNPVAPANDPRQLHCTPSFVPSHFPSLPPQHLPGEQGKEKSQRGFCECGGAEDGLSVYPRVTS